VTQREEPIALAVHELSAEPVHRVFSRDIPARLRVRPGDEVILHCQDASGGGVTPESTARTRRAGPAGHPLTGPVFVEGAEPGDTLVVDILGLQHHGWGWSSFAPGRGLLPDDFRESYLHIWRLEGDAAWLRPGVRVPLQPFPGIVGCAPAVSGEHPTMPPRRVGGNMDIRHLTAGSTLFLPVEVPGALFSAGDCHAAQGDGEVCITGIEAPMTLRVRFGLRKGQAMAFPEFRTPPGTLNPGADGAGFYATTGIGPDLRACAQDAVRGMIAYLGREHGLGREEAYVLCSVAADLRISEIVDLPSYVVSCYLPLGLFVG
jgi:acetamidase/formamidase